MIEKDIVRQARQTDLAEYLLSIGEPLIRSGKRYKHKVHDSLVITKNAYFWNSKGESGNAIDYLTRYMGMNFEAAIIALVGFLPSKEIAEQEKKIDLMTAPDYRRTFAYLQKSRGINGRLIQKMIETGHLKQEAKTNNAVFVIYDEFGERVGAELEGTLSDKRFKGMESGSKYGYGFNISMPIEAPKKKFAGQEKKDFDYCYCLFFESAIDLISFVELEMSYKNKSLHKCLLVSISGLKMNVLEHMAAIFGGLPVLCIDNDSAADEFIGNVIAKKIKHRLNRPNKSYKDWNEELKSIKNY